MLRHECRSRIPNHEILDIQITKILFIFPYKIRNSNATPYDDLLYPLENYVTQLEQYIVYFGMRAAPVDQSRRPLITHCWAEPVTWKLADGSNSYSPWTGGVWVEFRGRLVHLGIPIMDGITAFSTAKGFLYKFWQ